MLEELEHAEARRDILAELVGYGANSDAHHVTPSRPRARARRAACAWRWPDAELAPEDIGYINAHGTSTPFNDANETRRSRRSSVRTPGSC